MNGLFYVQSCYSSLLRNAEILYTNILNLLKDPWHNDALSKVHVFGWRLLLDRLPPKAALQHRGILIESQDLICMFCENAIEDCAHLFFSCPTSGRIWQEISKWLGKSITASGEGWSHFQLFGNLLTTHKYKRVSHLIWMTTTWSIWKLRNNMIFKAATLQAPQLVFFL
jgi:hypothetical protein